MALKTIAGAVLCALSASQDITFLDDGDGLSLLQLRSAVGAGKIEEPVCTYAEGSIDNAAYSTTYTTEAEAQTACNADATCKGVWSRNNAQWIPLFPAAPGRSWRRGVPNGTVSSVKVKTCAEPEPEPVAGCDSGKADYVEGTVDNAAYSTTYTTEVEAQTACNADATCKGIWSRNNAQWIPLFPAAPGRSWRRGVPNGTVSSVKVKTCVEPEPEEPEPVAGCDSGKADYVEGSIENAAYSTTYTTEAEAQTACNADATCKGTWTRNGGQWIPLFPAAAGRSWSRGVPNGTVSSVKVKTCFTEAVNDEAAAVGDPHLVSNTGSTQDLCCEGGVCHTCA